MPFSELQVPEQARGGIVTVGNFDGVHRGHQLMLARVREQADAANVPATVVTFDPHPIRILRPDVEIQRLTSLRTRTQLLEQYGATAVVVLPVSKPLLQLSADEFFQQFIRERLAANAVVEGPDFRFGRDRQGDVKTLELLCQQHDMQLTVIEPVESDAELISSTRIRSLIRDARMADAIRLLGHPYTIEGTVVRGAARGRTLRFPTANLAEICTMLPPAGVYAAKCQLGETIYPVATSIGPNPTFSDSTMKVECHLIGFSGDLYDKSLRVGIIEKVRGLHAFSDQGELQEQIQQDVNQCVAIATAPGK